MRRCRKVGVKTKGYLNIPYAGGNVNVFTKQKLCHTRVEALTLRVTRWTFDTCGCVVDVQWDDSLSVAQRVHVPVVIIQKCVTHANLGKDTQGHYDHISEENGRKNVAIGKLLEQKGISRDKYLAGAKGDRAFSDDITNTLSLLEWSFDAYDGTGTRPLKFKVNDPAVDKTQLAVNFQGIGKGKINIV